MPPKTIRTTFTITREAYDRLREQPNMSAFISEAIIEKAEAARNVQYVDLLAAKRVIQEMIDRYEEEF